MGLRTTAQPNAPKRRLSRSIALRTAATALVGAAALSMTACSSDDDGGNGHGEASIRMSWLKDISGAGEYFADQKGYYKQAGFNGAKLIAGGPTAPPVASDLVQGNAKFGIDGPEFISRAINKGVPLKVLGCQNQKSAMALVSAQSAGINSPHDLAGKKVGVQQANVPIWQAFMKANGMNPDAAKVVPIQGEATPLITGEIDAQLAFGEELPQVLDQRGFKYRRDLLSDFGLQNFSYCYVTLQKTIDDNRQSVVDFLAAELRGWRDAIADVPQSAKYTTQVYGSDLGLNAASQEGIMRATIDTMLTDESRANGLFTLSDASIAGQIKSLSLTGINVDPKKMFDTSLLADAYRQHPELRQPYQVG